MNAENEKKQKPLDPKDIELLRRIANDGPSFMKHHAHEARAHRLARRGFLISEEVAYKTTSTMVELRHRYAISEVGRERI